MGFAVLSFRGRGELENAMSSARYEQHQAPRCATGPADRTTGLTIDWNGVAVSGGGAFSWPQTTIVVTEKGNSGGEDIWRKRQALGPLDHCSCNPIKCKKKNKKNADVVKAGRRAWKKVMQKKK